jgi:acetylcholinesterase
VGISTPSGANSQNHAPVKTTNKTPWVERVQSAIIVTINYRVNIFGFPNARGLAQGEQNLGILDQRAALEWTYDNIAAFGGDPGRIMHWGRSAGSFSVDVHSYAYYDDPIAQSYFMESGTLFSLPLLEDATHSNFSFVAKNVGCEAPCGVDCVDDDGQAELDCMRLVSANQIINFLGLYGDRGEQPPLNFNLVPDDEVVFRDYHARSKEGKIASLPSIISFTANEWSSLAPWPKDNLTEGPWFPPILEMDIAFGACGTYNSTVYRNRLSTKEAPVFRFQYAAEFPNMNVYDWLGAYHNSETPLIFGQYRLLDHIAETTEFQIEVSESMQDHIMAFAQNPYNGPQDAFGWEPQVTSEPNGGVILRFGSGGIAAHIVDGIEVDGVCLGAGEYDPFP